MDDLERLDGAGIGGNWLPLSSEHDSIHTLSDTTARLPLDVHAIVMEWVYRSSQHDCLDYRTLLACARVCRSWTPIAQRLLFRRVPYSDDRDADYFFQTSHYEKLIRTLRANPHLATCVRCVYLNLWSGSRQTVVDETMVALLELCPAVKGVVFAREVKNTARTDALEARLRALPLRPIFLQAYGNARVLLRISELWPSVRMLDLREKGSVLDVIPIALPRGVESLCLHRDALEWNTQEDNICGVRHLEMYYLTGPCYRKLCVVGLLVRIRTLKIEGGFPPPDVWEHCTQLEGLEFDMLPEVALSLPRTLRYLVYGAGSRPWEGKTDARCIAAALPALVSLKLVTCTRSATAIQFATLERACRDCGVEFDVCEDALTLPNPRNVDWI
ncbi:hypothetical protein FA95DRAFT_1609501 [Auriscalpium vulgare]|uniref:Uncharacterized protein n=1 Tax=Auriscalpium vulgare TaxID=40419 RepID=A0ACB8RGT3_9AGAM|nr:hypothetical protein FA95DRAFT_1609501 [Auriscalpium vulgare]